MTKKILLIDDNADLAENLSDILLMEGYEVSIAGNGKEGLRALDQEPPDLIISDLIMPEIGGMEFIKTVRQKKQLTLPIIVLSANVTEDVMREGMVAGADLFLKKPCDADEFLGFVSSLINKNNGEN